MSSEDARLVQLSYSGDGTARITMNSPRNRNALSRQLLAELSESLQEISDNQTIRAIVLTGTGPVFCSGADLKEQQDGKGAGPVTFADVLIQILDHRCPIVARVNGPARAGGVGLMAACDIVVGFEAADFSFTEVRLGVVPALIAIPVLMRADSTAIHEYFLTAAAFDGRAAERIGLMNRAVPDGALDPVVDGYLAALRRGGPDALARTKQLRRLASHGSVIDGLRTMAEISVEHFQSAEGQEGISARRAGRDPAWLLEG